MSILGNDIRLLASAIMSDVPEGGGACSNNVIVNGSSNNIFDPISTLEETYGAVNLRKAFVHVNVQTAEKYYGSHIIISKLPINQRLGINLFKTDDHDDIRTDAAYRIENYRAKGAKYLGFLYGTQYQGSQTLTVFQSEAAAVPTVGEVLLLFIPLSNVEQYVLLTSVSSVVQPFTDANGAFTRRIVTAEISSPLVQDFVGSEMSRFDTITPAAQLYHTTVANAAKYYSARPLKNLASSGDFSVTVDTVYSQVVPASQSQTALTDVNAGGNASPIIDAATGLTSFTTDNILSASISLYLGRAFVPGTLTIAYNGGSITDNAGNVMLGGTSIGTCDYLAGTVSLGSNAPTLGSTKTVSFKPAGVPLTIADSDSIKITDLNRSFVYTYSINPPPQPGAVEVSYMALGTWFTLRDNGAGGLVAQAEGVGSGTVNYVTGTVAVTTSVLPDVGSELIVSWGKSVDYNNRAGGALALAITKQLSHTGIDATSFAVSWNDGAARTLTCGANGVLTGYGTGWLNPATGYVSFVPTTLPPKDTVFNFSYNYMSDGGSKVSKTMSTFNMNGNTVELNVLDTNLVAGSVVVEWSIPWGSSLPNIPMLTGDYMNLPNPASGSLQQSDRDNGAGSFVGGRSCTIDYAQGLISFNWNNPLPLKFPLFGNQKYSLAALNGIAYDPVGNPAIASLFKGYVSGIADMSTPTSFNVHYRLAGSLSAGSDTLTLANATFDIVPANNETIVPASVMFTFGARTYIDRSGQLYYNIDPFTGAGIYAGTLDYATGTCVLANWASGASNSGVVVSALSTPSFDPVDRVVFRTKMAPTKPGSLTISATKYGGGLISATANDQGVISTADMQGIVNDATGTVKVDFGTWVTAAGNEGQPWYNPAMVKNGQIFQPKPVLASTIKYNAVAYAYVPLSANILGLDPVRLPIDGRVPVYSKGDVVVVLNEQSLSGTYTSATTLDLARVRLAKVVVKDLGGNLLPTAKWSVNLDTGIITWGDLSGVSQPLTITHRVEDMAVVSDVQITGKLTLSKPVTHDYPVNGTVVANAVITGDMYAHSSIPFDQQTWNGVWSDTLIGSTTAAQFNHTDFPIVTLNDATVQERWLIIFTNANTVNVIGEHVGQVLTGASITTDIAPVNPDTNSPYFVLPHLGFGAGWSAGNLLRFNTYAAKSPVWIIQSIAQGEPTDPDNSFCIEARGDINPV